MARLNPKALEVGQLMGETVGGEWVDGVLSAMWTKFASQNRNEVTFIVCDGPVDSTWAENLNSVLDDNRILTKSNGALMTYKVFTWVINLRMQIYYNSPPLPLVNCTDKRGPRTDDREGGASL